jgi:hypothetical protein
MSPSETTVMRNGTPSREVQQCIRECTECASMCAQAAHYCLHKGGEHASPEHQAMLQDCQQMSSAAAGFMARMSKRAADLCLLCADICSDCADQCIRLANGDSLMTQCADVCRRCSKSCERTAGVAV